VRLNGTHHLLARHSDKLKDDLLWQVLDVAPQGCPEVGLNLGSNKPVK
jgi:hypothetical protein